MDLIARLTKSPRGAAFVGTFAALLVLIAVFIFGAPSWILVPAVWISATVHIEAKSWADRRLGPR